MEQTASEIRFMGIDYGEKRIGIALSDPLLTFAYPLTTLINNSSIFSELKKIINDKSITKIILGFPPIRFKSSKELSEKVLRFKSEIESLNKVEIILWDEEYSSAIAKEKIIQSVSKKSKRKEKDLLDKFAAAVILQEYLDSIKE